MDEIHLFIIWENALYKKDEILEDIKNNFEIVKKYMVTWTQEKFAENMSRFYGSNLPKGCGKVQHCGTGPFMLIIVRDKNPKYEERETSKGNFIVNARMFDKKAYYRELTGGGHKVHATNNVIETNHDITLLLHQSLEDFMKKIEKSNDNNEEKLEQDLIGADGWENVEEMFYALNNCTNYAILRNYENLPEEIYVNEHNDIDIICESQEDCMYVLNAKKVFPEEYRVHAGTLVEGKTAYFDVRHLGDNYYDEELEKNILKSRMWNEKGFFTISNDLYFYTLLYHALLHKNEFAEDYRKRLIKMNIEKVNNNTTEEDFIQILNQWLLDNKYIVRAPEDRTVLFNVKKASKLSKLISRDQEEIIDFRNKISELENEKRMLEDKNNQLQTELNNMANSISWKSTKWIRDIHTSMKNRK